jgi:uncharacterized Zn finger protein (UPF0148 family)
MDEKDRLGDKLRDKGKAAEDLYIAEQERLRLERLKQKAATGNHACPKDGTALVARAEHGITVDGCPSCGGVWLDNGELEAILAREDEAGVTRWVRSLLKS